ncbi:MAG: STN domain-containing protein, partial [Gammaproteobacteria bacterium]
MHFSPPAALGLWFGMAAVAQAAQENPIDFNIPAQPLAAALDAFSKQSGVNLFYADGILQGKRSAGLQGVYRPAEA